jgi:hypothetical protein
MADDTTLSQFLGDLKKAVDTKGAAEELMSTFKEVIRIFNSMKDESEDDRKDFMEMFDLATSDFQVKFAEYQRNATADIAKALGRLETRMAEITSGQDGITPDINELAQMAADLIKLPEQRAAIMDGPQELRDKLELLADEELPKFIVDLRKDIDDFKKWRKSRAVAGTASASIAHWPIHETFTMDGVATTVTLREGVGAQGTAIFGLRYQGQVQVLGTDYTVDGNKITFVSFVPEANTIVSISYLP